MLMRQPEQRGVGQIHEQIAVLPHPAGHQFQGGSTQKSKAQATERYTPKEARCHFRRDQMADLGENRPGGNESPGVLQEKEAQVSWSWSRRLNQATRGPVSRMVEPRKLVLLLLPARSAVAADVAGPASGGVGPNAPVRCWCWRPLGRRWRSCRSGQGARPEPQGWQIAAATAGGLPSPPRSD